MSQSPVICFGQQPCGIFPRRYLYAKVLTARRLQAELGGKIVFFYHDSDHDPRETKIVLRHRKNNEPFEINFTFDNKLQRKFSPMYLKRVRADWHAKTVMQLPAYADKKWVEAFRAIPLTNVADFCMAMYRRMGLMDGIEVCRSADPAVRKAACGIDDYFVDVPFEGEVVRARLVDSKLQLHEGGDSVINLPLSPYSKEQISPSRDTRLRWMQSVLHCTHYIAGLGERAYLHKDDAPEVEFVTRDDIDHSDEAFTEISR